MRKTTVTAFTLLLLTPSFALAMGCGKGHYIKEDTAAISCADGMSYDADAQKCVETVG